MKRKNIVFVCALFISQMSFGQLKVNETGSIFMGELAPFSGGFLNIGSASKVGINIMPEIATAWGDVVRVTLKKNGIGAFVVRNPNYQNVGGAGTNIVFQVQGDGYVYTKGQYLTWSTPNTSEYTTRSLPIFENTLNKLKQLNAISYQPQINSNISRIGEELSTDSISEQSLAINEENHKSRIGLSAQELENVFPEVVYTFPTGEKAIAYTELIPILVEAIKEQQSRIESLETLLSNSDKKKTIEHKPAISQKIDETVLYQNTPNPFNQETSIAYRIPGNVTASICIYNLSGQQLKKYTLAETNGKITVQASEFPVGIYIYSLIINNQEFDSKRMVLTS